MPRLSDSSIAALAKANYRASPLLAILWWATVVFRAAVPAVLTLGLGSLVGAISDGASIDVPLAVVASSFAFMSIAGPLHTQIGAILGDRTSGYLQAALTEACSGPAGIAHLERPNLADELVAARDFDLGIMGPPISVSMGFVGAGLVELLGGVAQTVALATVTWWGAMIVAAGWVATHWLLRSASFWANRDDADIQRQQRHTDYRLSPRRRRRTCQGDSGLRYGRVGRRLSSRLVARSCSTCNGRRRGSSNVRYSLVFVVLAATHAVLLVPLISSAIDGDRSLASIVVAAQALVGMTALGVGIAFSWALDSAAAPMKALTKLSPRMAAEGKLAPTTGRRPIRGRARHARSGFATSDSLIRRVALLSTND